MKAQIHLVSLLALITLAVPALAADYIHSTPAVQGYDVVSYHTGKRPVRGNGHFVAYHDDAMYQFSSEENRTLFEANAEKYAPAYNGYCAFGVSVGKKFIGDPEVWRLVDGKLYLNLDTNVQSEWLQDVPGRIQTANTNWQDIRDKSPQEL